MDRANIRALRILLLEAWKVKDYETVKKISDDLGPRIILNICSFTNNYDLLRFILNLSDEWRLAILAEL